MIATSRNLLVLAAVAVLPMTGCSGVGGPAQSIPAASQQVVGLSAASHTAGKGMRPLDGTCEPAAAPWPIAGNLTPDGDFSDAVGPNGDATYFPGPLSTTSWHVMKYDVDLVDSTYWPTLPGTLGGGVCTVDLDGSPGDGGISSSSFLTTPGNKYYVRFMLSGSVPAPGVNHMTLHASPSLTPGMPYNWPTAGNQDVYHDVYKPKCWPFKASGLHTIVTFKSTDPDPHHSVDGAVITEISVTGNPCP